MFFEWKVHLADSFSLSRQKTLLPFTFTNDMTAILISDRLCTCWCHRMLSICCCYLGYFSRFCSFRELNYNKNAMKSFFSSFSYYSFSSFLWKDLLFYMLLSLTMCWHLLIGFGGFIISLLYLHQISNTLKHLQYGNKDKEVPLS